MKKLLAALLLACLPFALGSCQTSGTRDESRWTARQMADRIWASQESSLEMTAILPPDDYYETYLTTIYGLDEADVTDGAILAAGGTSAQEIAVFRLKEGASPDGAADTLRLYLENRVGSFIGYAPGEAALLENAQVVVRGDFVALLACRDMEAAQNAFALCFEEEPPKEEASASSPGSAQENIPEGALSSAGEGASIPANPSWVYGESRLLEAWAAGDWSGLSREDQAILDACRKVISTVVPADGSDYDKELAIHDWMIEWGSYDSDTLSQSPDFEETPNNDNPYGFLINGKGICLGYVTTFQLFMDLLGIECITVEGTADRDNADHAWNQVRLDGEWYCVDVTWDDPITNGTPSEEDTHYFFNVTSEHMRDTYHYWEEAAVPEATGTAYAWKN